MKYQLNWHYGMAHFTLSKFKKAGQLAFLTGFIFVLSSCGGGGGGGNPPTDPTYTYKSFSEINASGVALSEACEAQESSCTESNALSLWQEISNASEVIINIFLKEPLSSLIFSNVS